MAGIRLLPEDSDVLLPQLQQTRLTGAGDLVSDDDRSVAADSWSIKSDYGSTLDDDQRHADATEALSSGNIRAASDYSSDKEEQDPEALTSMLGFQSYWDAAYADELTNFHEHGHAGEVWFGVDVMDSVASWTKNICIEISQSHKLNHDDDTTSEPIEHDEHYLSEWSVLDIGTGNGLLLQELAKQGSPDLVTGNRNYTYMHVVQESLGRRKVQICGLAQYGNMVGTTIGYNLTTSISMVWLSRGQIVFTRMVIMQSVLHQIIHI